MYQKTAVFCLDDGMIYKTPADAAKAYGLSRSAMCNHLAGRQAHVKGKRFIRYNTTQKEA